MTFGETMHRHIASGMSAPQAMKATWKDVHAGKAQRPPHRGSRRHHHRGRPGAENWSGFGALNPRHRARRRSGGGGKARGGGWLMPALLIGGGFLLLKSGALGTMFGGSAAPLGAAPAGMYWDPTTRTYRAIPATGIPAYAQQTITALGGIQGIIGTIQSWFAAPMASSPVATAGAVPLDAMYADFLAAQGPSGIMTVDPSYVPPLVDVTDPLATGIDPFAAVGIAQGVPVLSQDLTLVPFDWTGPDSTWGGYPPGYPPGGQNMDWAWGV